MRDLNSIKWLKAGFAITATITLVAFTLAGAFPSEFTSALVKSIIFFYLGVVVLRAVFFFTGSFLQRIDVLRLNRLSLKNFRRPMVSVIMPCYNEEDVIEASLRNLTQLTYPNLEIIVVNDGSSDRTSYLAHAEALHSPRTPVKVLDQRNQGKASALNHGLLHAQGEIIMCVDADSRMNPDAVEMGVRQFQDHRVGAVAGFVEIVNQRSVLLLLQQMEYLVGLNFTRRAMSFLGVVPIVPGPAGLFRRKALMQAGGFISGKNIFAEDAELSMRLLTKGWKIQTEDQMVARTEAPETHRDLLRQRYRWNRGTYQALLLNFFSLLESGWRGRWIAFHLLLESVITPVLNFGLILYFLTYFFTTGNLEMFTMWYFYLLGIDLLTTVMAVHNQGRMPMWIALTFVNKIYYFYMLLTWRLLSLYEEWLGVDMTWDKLNREGSVLKESLHA